MAISPTLIVLSILYFISCTQTASVGAATVPRAYTDFIQSKCNITTYPSLCIKTLTPYASSIQTNPLYLCNLALNLAIKSDKKPTVPLKKNAKSVAVLPAYTDFIRSKCNITTNPSLCIKTLTPFASSIKTNPLYLCNLALNLAIRSAKNAYTDFVRSKCSLTTSPSLCIKTLIPYASSIKTNPLYLCNVAVNVAIKSAKNASSSVTKLLSEKGITRIEAALIKECVGSIKDAIYELKDTLTAMEHLEDPDRDLEWSNAKTWASAAITDAETCKYGFSDQKLNGTDLEKNVASYIDNVEEHIGHALCLINHLY